MKNKSIILMILIVCIYFQSLAQQKTKSSFMVKDLKNYSFVPMGKVRIDSSTIYLPTNKVHKDTTSIQVQAFYISKYEVSNAEYKQFLDYLKQHNEVEKLKIAQIDTLKWHDKLSYNEPYVQYYHTHPAYANYPVVNVSYEGAVLYCQWLSQMYNESHPNEKIKVDFRLPTRAEWIRAARGEDTYKEYTWGGPNLTNNKGIYLCNFRKIGENRIHVNPTTGAFEVMNSFGLYDAADITAPVNSYYPNSLGIYNMCGNVAEMVTEKGIAVGGSWKDTGYDVRIESTKNYTEASSSIGFRPVRTFIGK